MRTSNPWSSLALLAVVGGGCYSSAEYDPKVRRERLLAIYPPGETSRSDVQRRWGRNSPELAVARPIDGWVALADARVCDHVAASEQRTARLVHRVDRYIGPDRLFGLCYCWFYYDETDAVVDVEWEYHSD